MKYMYIAISAETKNDTAEKTIKDFLALLVDGWVILSAVGTAGGVHYVITYDDSPPVRPVMPSAIPGTATK